MADHRWGAWVLVPISDHDASRLGDALVEKSERLDRGVDVDTAAAVRVNASVVCVRCGVAYLEGRATRCAGPG